MFVCRALHCTNAGGASSAIATYSLSGGLGSSSNHFRILRRCQPYQAGNSMQNQAMSTSTSSCVHENHTPSIIQLHPLSDNPTEAWNVLEKSGQVVHRVERMVHRNDATMVKPDHVRFVCISDTHSLHSRMIHSIPKGDILLHAGDFTRQGLSTEVKDFDNFLGNLPHKHKIVIAGNHELSFDEKFHDQTEKVKNQDLITNGIYLEDSFTVIYGIKIYGTPWYPLIWQPEFGGWAFNIPRGKACLDKWNLIPNDIDVLLSHTPPLGHGDLCRSGVRAGCAELLTTVQQRVKPLFHVFGHIHEGYGITTDGFTTYINCATCTIKFQPNNEPIIFDFPMPPGQTK